MKNLYMHPYLINHNMFNGFTAIMNNTIKIYKQNNILKEHVPASDAYLESATDLQEMIHNLVCEQHPNEVRLTETGLSPVFHKLV